MFNGYNIGDQHITYCIFKDIELNVFESQNVCVRASMCLCARIEVRSEKCDKACKNDEEMNARTQLANQQSRRR